PPPPPRSSRNLLKTRKYSPIISSSPANLPTNRSRIEVDDSELRWSVLAAQHPRSRLSRHRSPATRDRRHLSRSPVPSRTRSPYHVAHERLISFRQGAPAGAYPPSGLGRFILDQLAFELPDAGEHLGLTGGAVVNRGLDRLGG